MGGGQSDPAINIRITLTSNNIFPDSLVEGIVYLQLTERRNLTSINIILKCNERCQWVKVYGHSVVVYGNKLETYNSQYELKKIDQWIDPGKYSYSFRFLLPNLLPGSLSLSNNNYITNTLTAQVRQITQQNYIVTSTIPFLVQQPQRNPEKLNNQTESEVKCWSCCCLQNKVGFKIRISNNHIRNGDVIDCFLQVNNIMGSDKISSVVIMLNQYIKQVSDWDYENQYNWQGSIHPGSMETIQAYLQIPQEIPFCSSIGQTIERFYLIQAYCDFGCCSNNAAISIPVIANTSAMDNNLNNPENSGMNSSYGYGDYFNEKTEIGQLSPYIYSPKKGMVYLNQSDRVAQGINTNTQKISNQNRSQFQPSRNENINEMINIEFGYGKGNLLENQYN